MAPIILTAEEKNKRLRQRREERALVKLKREAHEAHCEKMQQQSVLWRTKHWTDLDEHWSKTGQIGDEWWLKSSVPATKRYIN
jgi:hypothetical protein